MANPHGRLELRLWRALFIELNVKAACLQLLSVTRYARWYFGGYDVRRRDLIALLGSTAAWPLIASAQQVSKPRLIAVLSPVAKTAAATNNDALRHGLREFGYVEDRDFRFEIRYADGDIGSLSRLAAELVALRPAVIVAGSPPAALAAKGATDTIPIVMNSSADPVAIGLAKTLAQPGGNVTGFWWGDPALTGKRFALLKQAVPILDRAALFVNPNDPSDANEASAAIQSSKALNLTIRVLEVRKAADYKNAFAIAMREKVQGLVLAQGPLFVSSRVELAKLALATNLPVIGSFRGFAEVGTLASYGASLPDIYRRKAEFIDKIFKGAKPRELPIERPTKFEFLINLKTAKALGLEMAPSLLQLADELIE